MLGRSSVLVLGGGGSSTVHGTKGKQCYFVDLTSGKIFWFIIPVVVGHVSPC